MWFLAKDGEKKCHRTDPTETAGTRCRFPMVRCERHVAGGEETHRRNHFHPGSLGGAKGKEKRWETKQGLFSKTCLILTTSIGFSIQCVNDRTPPLDWKMQPF